MGAFTPPWVKSLIFLRVFLVFLRLPGLENAEFHIISAFSWKFVKISKKSCILPLKHVFMIFSILGCTDPQETPIIP